MSDLTAKGVGRRLGAAIALCLALAASPALAQTSASGDAPPSESLAVNLIELLVKQGVISRTAADQLLKQAEQETAQAKAASLAAASLNAGPATSGATIVGGGAGTGAGGVVAVASLPPAPAGVVRVPYVPQIVRDQIRDEVKAEVMTQAKAEGWAQPGALPGWLDKITISGDVRLRSQYNLYSGNNATGLINYAAFNANGPTDINPDTNLVYPYLNSHSDSLNQLSLRARLAIDAKLSDSLGAGIRLATGDSNGPVSTTTLLGGGLGKNNIWLDRGFVWFKPADWIGFTAGRFANPFMSTDLLYSDDLNFDGAAWRFSHDLPRNDIKLAFVGGAFPLGYSAANFPTDAVNKDPAASKWLFAGQASLDWDTTRFDWKTAVGFYDFNGARGLLSQPCALYNGNNACSSDFSAPAFMQQGNTLFLIRDILPNPASPLDYAQPQLVGLRFAYRLFNLTSQFDYRVDVSHHLVLTADYVRNVAYDYHDICRNAPFGAPVNNLVDPTNTGAATINSDVCETIASEPQARVRSGPNAWLVKMLYGDPDPTRFGEWNISAGYRYIQPDAMLDAFNSPDFHLGGTNAKGYTLAATAGLYDGAYLQARWFSANEVYGPPLAIDVGQIELHVRF